MSDLEAWLKDFKRNAYLACQSAQREDGAKAGEWLKQQTDGPPKDYDLWARMAADLLAPETRLVRRNLMVASTVAVLMSAGARPNVLVQFGDRGWLPLVAAAVVTAFLTAEFWVYRRFDQSRWNEAVELGKSLKQLRDDAETALELARSRIGSSTLEKLVPMLQGLKFPERPVGRPIFDYHLPMLWGVVAVGCCVGALLHLHGFGLCGHAICR